MNSTLREDLTALLADHLTMQESARIIAGYQPKTPWDRWHLVAADAMEFIYGDETPPTGQEDDDRSDPAGNPDSPACRGGHCGCGQCRNLDSVGGVEPEFLTGVVNPPTTELRDRLAQLFVPTPGAFRQSPTGESVPDPVSDSGPSAPSTPARAEEA